MLLVDLYLLRPDPYRHACESPRAGLYIGLFLIATGSLYGILLSLFQRARGGALQGFAVETIPDGVLYGGNVLSGILIAVVVHAGITLVSWLMAKAIGGPGLLVVFYRTTAYLLALGWLALPMVAATAATATMDGDGALPLAPLHLPLAVAGLALFLGGLFQIYWLTQEKGLVRSALAVAMFSLFSFAILMVF